jgi:hypothetical protein
MENSNTLTNKTEANRFYTQLQLLLYYLSATCSGFLKRHFQADCLSSKEHIRFNAINIEQDFVLHKIIRGYYIKISLEATVKSVNTISIKIY